MQPPDGDAMDMALRDLVPHAVPSSDGDKVAVAMKAILGDRPWVVVTVNEKGDCLPITAGTPPGKAVALLSGAIYGLSMYMQWQFRIERTPAADGYLVSPKEDFVQDEVAQVSWHIPTPVPGLTYTEGDDALLVTLVDRDDRRQVFRFPQFFHERALIVGLHEGQPALTVRFNPVSL